MKTKLLGFTVFLAFSITAIKGQNLTGKVVDEQNYPVETASVVLLKGDSTTLISGTITDAEGNFMFNNLGKGTYLLAVTYLNSVQVFQPVILEKDINLNIPITTTKVLDELTVSSDRSNIVSQTASGVVFHLSSKSKQSKDIYEAMQEVPKLMIDRNTRSIQMTDGSNPLILINGIRREGGINSIKPSDIESIEIIETPSARYSKEGYTAIVNIKVKRKADNYNYVNVGARLNPKLIFGLGDASYETGNDRFSLYATGQHFHFYKNTSNITDIVKSGSLTKETMNSRLSNYYDNSAIVGGDYVWSERDYSSFSVTWHKILSNSISDGNGKIFNSENQEKEFTHHREFDDRMVINTNNFYHKHTLTDNSNLEALLSVNFNKNNNKVNQKDEGEVYNFQTNKLFLNNRKSGSFSLLYNFSLGEGWDLTTGSQTNYQYNAINYSTHNVPIFHHSEWNEHLFTDFSKMWNKKLAVSASLGLDIYFTQSDKRKNKYYFLRPSASVGYRINSHNTIKFNFSRNANTPSVVLLNPYNVSTDSLTVISGNPYLKPEFANNVKLSYTYTKKVVFIEPYLALTNRTNYIRYKGEIEDNIYIQKPVNSGNFTNLQTGLNARLMLKNIGFIRGNIAYQYYNFETGNQKHSMTGGFDIYLYYKDLSMLARHQNNGPIFTPVSKEQASPESQLTFSYSINDNWEVTTGIRYVFSHKSFEQWSYEPGYDNYYKNQFVNRGNIVQFGFRYNLDQRNKKRSQKKLEENESGFRLINE